MFAGGAIWILTHGHMLGVFQYGQDDDPNEPLAINFGVDEGWDTLNHRCEIFFFF